jgi:methyltransferase
MSSAVLVSALTLAAVFLMMGAEALLSSVNERGLRARGAIEAPGDVHAAMAVAYPACYLAMGAEGALRGPSPAWALLAGLALLGLAKALKFWAIASLGSRWSVRVLVLPGQPPVAAGAYRYLRHPGALAVIGELLAVALIVGAPIAGLASLAGLGPLIRRRVAVEEAAFAGHA